MKIGLVSTYPPTRCGIATYAADLAPALAATEGVSSVTVLAEEGAGPSDAPGVEVVPCWRRTGDWVGDILRAADRTGVDVVHVQHAPDILGVDDRTPALVAGAAAAGRAAAVTIHTVYGTPGRIEADRARAAPAFHQGIAAHGRIIVHHASQRALVEAHGVAPERVVAIPHGTELQPPMDRRDARRALGLPEDGVVFLHFGFIHAQKNLHTALAGFLLALPLARRARLVVAGSPGGDAWYNKAYVRALQAGAALPTALRRVVWRVGFVAREDVARYFAAADVVLLPHALQPYGSASGVLHRALGAGRAVLASLEPKFRELQDAAGVPDVCAVPAHEPLRWARSIVALTRDETLRRRAEAALAAHAAETSWPVVAGQHAAVFRAALDDHAE